MLHIGYKAMSDVFSVMTKLGNQLDREILRLFCKRVYIINMADMTMS